ncbi:UDP-N-acetylmuramate--L-alanine ligase [Candidatus Margulisiibacteriota bacterium]
MLKDLTKNKVIHFIGIGGAGMSAIARILLLQGYHITGSDAKESANTLRLQELGAHVFIGHDTSHIREANIIVASAAIKADNIELIAASKRNLEIYGRAQMLSWLMSQAKTSIAFAGTHGKTTTSSMASLLFIRTKLKPTFLVGSELLDLGTNADMGDWDYFLAEADESDGSILQLDPTIMVLTNIEADHLEHFGNFENIIDTFAKCVEKLPKDKGVLITQGDQWGVKGFLKKLKEENKLPAKVVTYGLEADMDLRPGNIRLREHGSKFTVFYKDKQLGEVELSIPGTHNILNALSIIACGFEAGLSFAQISVNLKSFTGTKRRFNLIGDVQNVLIFDDYGHHPTEIAATLEAAKHSWQDRRLICIFQPHRYTRTMFLAHEFAQCFQHADIVILTDIYAAYEKPIPGITTDAIVKLMKEKTPVYIPKKEEISNYIAEHAQSGDLIITMGAGDIHIVAKEILSRLKQRKLKGWAEYASAETRAA